MENSHIEWTDNTFNPWWGCTKVSDGCKFCYAETLDNRYNHENPHWGPGSSRKPMSGEYWRKPLQWEKQAILEGRIIKVFCASMADVFEDHPEVIEWRLKLFSLIEKTPHLIWQLLTKRPENIMELIPGYWKLRFPDNVWIGTTIENQEAADLRIPYLLQVPAKVRFLSCEPLLSTIELRKFHHGKNPYSAGMNAGGREIGPAISQIQWVICGGESGHNARPVHPDWARSLRDQCKEAGVPFFFKQWGNWHESDLDEGKGISPNKRYLWPGGKLMYNIGKKAAGALLDGVEHKEFPKI